MMRFWLSLGLAGLAPLLVPLAALAACPGQTQLEINDCAQAEFARADAALNAAWGPAKQVYDGSGAGPQLLSAQRAWLTFRDAQCRAESDAFAGGSIQPLIHWNCLTRLTLQRTADLRALAAN